LFYGPVLPYLFGLWGVVGCLVEGEGEKERERERERVRESDIYRKRERERKSERERARAADPLLVEKQCKGRTSTPGRWMNSKIRICYCFATVLLRLGHTFGKRFEKFSRGCSRQKRFCYFPDQMLSKERGTDSHEA